MSTSFFHFADEMADPQKLRLSQDFITNKLGPKVFPFLVLYSPMFLQQLMQSIHCNKYLWRPVTHICQHSDIKYYGVPNRCQILFWGKIPISAFSRGVVQWHDRYVNKRSTQNIAVKVLWYRVMSQQRGRGELQGDTGSGETSKRSRQLCRMLKAGYELRSRLKGGRVVWV